MIAMFALVRAPDAIVSCVSQENARVLNRPDGKERLFNSGAESVGSKPEQRVATVTSEMARIGKLIKDAGLRDE
jgi:tripartite-type tricarboxylate transporter receptor subunit TctC